MNTLSLNYVRQFAEICDTVPPCEIAEVAARIIEVLPDMLRVPFDYDWSDRRARVQGLLDDKAYESALMALIPEDTRISASLGQPFRFTFTQNSRRVALRSYTSNSPVFSLALLGCYLRFIADEAELPPSEHCLEAAEHPRLRLVSST